MNKYVKHCKNCKYVSYIKMSASLFYNWYMYKSYIRLDIFAFIIFAGEIFFIEFITFYYYTNLLTSTLQLQLNFGIHKYHTPHTILKGGSNFSQQA